MFKRVLGFEIPTEGPDFLKLTLTSLFADMWSREGLGLRERRFLTLGILAAHGKADAVEEHIRAALVTGDLTKKELEEVAIHVAHYAGWSVGSMVFNKVLEVSAQLDKK